MSSVRMSVCTPLMLAGSRNAAAKRRSCATASSTTRSAPSPSRPRRCCATTSAAGQELAFELDEGHRRGGPALYHYRPLTREYIAERWDRLRFLPSAADACEALDSGAAGYLRMSGMRGAEAEPALRALLERLYEELSDFAFPEERFERVYREVESTLYERSQSATVLVPVHGLEMEADRVDLGGGLSLVNGERTDAPDEAVWAGSDGEPSALLMLEREVAPEDPVPLEDSAPGLPPATARDAAVQAGRDRAGRGGLAPHGRRTLGADRAGAHRRGPRRAVDPGRGRRGGAVPVPGRGRGSAPHRAGGVGAVAVPDGRRPPAGGRGADRLPAGAAGARSTRATPPWRCGSRCCAPRRASAAGCSAGSSWPRRWSAS